MKVGPEGGLATSLVTEADGVPLRFTNDLDIDDAGNIYFTDSSSKYQRRNFMQLVFSSEDSGRLLKYDPLTKETTVLLRGLQFPNGVSLSKDGSFLVLCEGSPGRLVKYWLKGDKAGTSEVFAILPGYPDNVRTNEKAPDSNKVPVPASHWGPASCGGCQVQPEGKLVKILEDSEGKVVRAVSEVEEREGKLWMGSVLMPFVAVYQLE
ncbi:Protein strictosidine synthase-like 3 [Vitis vinifera]|uniref:Protein strictosidine synthase-like 3 n=1 Tax=Vitis vinifera TaxID=29760 RepID=A0A438HBC4_VITVI|nr:Protein strictosidine synthase-like 3 [Vitis vinifera]